MKRTKSHKAMPKFVPVLLDAGWVLKTTPHPVMQSMGLDDEYIFVRSSDRLLHLHVSDSGSTPWEAKRYVREPFGDYTTVYTAVQSGSGAESMRQFAAFRQEVKS